MRVACSFYCSESNCVAPTSPHPHPEALTFKEESSPALFQTVHALHPKVAADGHQVDHERPTSKYRAMWWARRVGQRCPTESLLTSLPGIFPTEADVRTTCKLARTSCCHKSWKKRQRKAKSHSPKMSAVLFRQRAPEFTLIRSTSVVA